MALNTPTSADGWSPDVVAFAPQDAVPDALILQTSVVSGTVEGDEPAVRVLHVTDASAGFVAEGADITDTDPTLAETLVYTGKVAQLVKISREQYGQHRTAGLLSDSMRRAVTTAANTAYLSQAAPGGGASTPPAGLLNVSGIEDGGTVATDLDSVVDAVAHIEGDGGQATHIVAAPDAWAELRKLKTASASNQSLVGAGVEDARRQLLGVPVLVSAAMTSGGILVLDRSAVVSAAGSVLVATSTDRYFESDSVAVRVTWRFGQNVVRPERVVKLAIAVPEEESSSSSSSSS